MKILRYEHKKLSARIKELEIANKILQIRLVATEKFNRLYDWNDYILDIISRILAGLIVLFICILIICMMIGVVCFTYNLIMI